MFDLKGQLRMATRSAENGDTEVLRVDADAFTKVYSCSVFESCNPLQFQPGDQRVYMETNKGADLTSLELLDPQTGKTEMVESDPLGKVDFGGALFSEATDELVETWYFAARVKTYYKNKAFGDDVHWIEHKFPEHEIMVVSRTKDEQIWLVTAVSDTEPGETMLFDRKTHVLTPQYQSPRETPACRPGPDEARHLQVFRRFGDSGLSHRSERGSGQESAHSDPSPRRSLGTRPVGVQLVGAVLRQSRLRRTQPNFRGSTGYGRKFLDAGNLEWGRKMQDDLTWGVKYLVAQGIADPKRVGIIGGSYGGYATLAGVAFTPDLYAAAVDIVGPSNLITLLDSIPPYWESIRKMFYQRMGDPNTPQGKALLMEESPLNSADKIKTPLLVAQGANDPRVNRREAEQIVIALRDRGFPVEYILAPDEGHGFARPINNLALFMASEKFFAQHLGGKYQEGGTAEEVARLKEITVDPKDGRPCALMVAQMSGTTYQEFWHTSGLRSDESVEFIESIAHQICTLQTLKDCYASRMNTYKKLGGGE